MKKRFGKWTSDLFLVPKQIQVQIQGLHDLLTWIKKKNLAHVYYKLLYVFCCRTGDAALNFPNILLWLLQTQKACVLWVSIKIPPVSLSIQRKLNSSQNCWCLESKQTVTASKVAINQVHWPQAWFNRQHLLSMCFSWFTDNCSPECSLTGAHTPRGTHKPNNKSFVLLIFSWNTMPWVN